MAFEEFLGKHVKIIYVDGMTSQGGDHYSKREGHLIEINPTHAIIKLNSHTEAILLAKILRMEVI